jgi:hypothetical protein
MKEKKKSGTGDPGSLIRLPEVMSPATIMPLKASSTDPDPGRYVINTTDKHE